MSKGYRLIRRLSIVVLSLLAPATVAHAQAATVLFDAATGTTPATANQWTSVLYVNGTPFPMVHTCTLVGAVTTCTSPLPNVTTALTPVGSQTFNVTFKDIILGESPQSGPLTRIRPAAPFPPRIQ